MVTETKSKRAFRCIQLAAIGLYFVFHLGCTAAPTSISVLYRETSCPPEEVISQLRQNLSKQSIATSNASPEGKGFVIYTESILERSGKQERLGRYKVVVQPVESSDKSVITIERLEGKSKGIHERKWYDDEVAVSKPPSEQQIWLQIEGVCAKGQQ